MYKYIIKNNDTKEEKIILEYSIKFIIFDLEYGNYTIIRCDINTGEVLKVFSYSLLEENI